MSTSEARGINHFKRSGLRKKRAQVLPSGGVTHDGQRHALPLTPPSPPRSRVTRGTRPPTRLPACQPAPTPTILPVARQLRRPPARSPARYKKAA